MFLSLRRVRVTLGAAVLFLSLLSPVTFAPSNPTTPQSIHLPTPTKPTDTLLCLAQALFFEASIEPIDGREAVAAAIFNRVVHGDWPRSVCAVVYQRQQFSWTADMRNWTRRPPAQFVTLARSLWGRREEIREKYPVTHFHHHSISPAWAERLELRYETGHHRFYGV